METVDDVTFTLHLTGLRRFMPDVGPDSLRSTSSACGKNRDESIHNLSTENSRISQIHILDVISTSAHICGVGCKWLSGLLAYLSTFKVTYPQITGTYPQTGCFHKRSRLGNAVNVAPATVQSSTQPTNSWSRSPRIGFDCPIRQDETYPNGKEPPS